MKVLITGPPKCGKSTLISRLIKHYSNYIIYGFITPEVRKDAKRIGFDIIDIYSNERIQLARISNYKTKHKLGKYNVFIEDFDKIVSNLEIHEKHKVDLIIIDEIGKMELFSKKFEELIRKIFQSDIPIIATIGQKMQHPVKDYILNFSGVKIFNLTLQNQLEVFQKIISIIFSGDHTNIE